VPEPPVGEVVLPAAELAEVIGEMDRDVERLRKVASRFSRVGSEPNLQVADPVAVVHEVAAYMRRRFPHVAHDVELRERYLTVPQVRLDPELLAWAIENLIANSLSALERRPSWIEVAVAPSADGQAVEI